MVDTKVFQRFKGRRVNTKGLERIREKHGIVPSMTVDLIFLNATRYY